jgi:hypothetical protein
MEEERASVRLRQQIRAWETEVLPNWEQVKRTKRVREMWIEGVPDSIRGKVWYFAFGNRNSITKDLYYIKSD